MGVVRMYRCGCRYIDILILLNPIYSTCISSFFAAAASPVIMVYISIIIMP